MDDISKIFANATIADFIIETSAVNETPNLHIDYGQFRDAHLASMRNTFLATDGELNPTCFLANGQTVRVFVPDEEETVGEFVNRCALEARLMQAHWVFFAMITQLRVTHLPASEIDDSVQVDDPSQEVDWPEGLIWYSERSDGTRSHISGTILRQEGRLVETNNTIQAFPLAALILDA